MPDRMTPLQAFEAQHVRARPGRTLIVGAKVYGTKEDRRARFPKVVGVDMEAGPGVDRVLDLEEPLPDDLGRFTHVECMSVLEHSRRPWLLAENLVRLLVPGGTLFVTVPFVWRFHGYPTDYFRFTADGVRALFSGIRWEQVMYASDKLRPDHYLQAGEDERAHPLLPRCEVAGFGVRE